MCQYVSVLCESLRAAYTAITTAPYNGVLPLLHALLTCPKRTLLKATLGLAVVVTTFPHARAWLSASLVVVAEVVPCKRRRHVKYDG